MIDFIDCRNVHISGVTLQNSPCWTLRLHACGNVEISRIVIRNPHFGPNTDGIDVGCSSDVHISDCDISTGDDAICIKSERMFGLLRPVSNVMIENCRVDTPCNGIKIGTGTMGPVSGIHVRKCSISQKHELLRDRMIAGLALEAVDGGSLQNCTFEDIDIDGARTPIFIRLGDRGRGQPGQHSVGSIDGLRLARIRAKGAISSSIIAGIPGYPVRNIEWTSIEVESVEQEGGEFARRAVPEVPARYPEANMFGRLPSTILYCRHVQGLALTNVSASCGPATRRPPVLCEDIAGLNVKGFHFTNVEGGQPLFHLKRVQGEIREISQEPGCREVLFLDGDANQVTGDEQHVCASASPELWNQSWTRARKLVHAS
jgi:hypothetical protein